MDREILKKLSKEQLIELALTAMADKDHVDEIINRLEDKYEDENEDKKYNKVYHDHIREVNSAIK